MERNHRNISLGGFVVTLIIIITTITIQQGYVSNSNWYLALVVLIPLLILAIVAYRNDLL